MTNNHLLLYRLAKLMLEKQQHILPLDDLFEDEQIGSFVRSIQIDSPYQQLIFEGVLTETIKVERVMVTFTVEGYFHHVLGEVIEQQTEGKDASLLKELLENNQLRGITEGVEQCLVRDVEKDDLSRLMWLIDEGGKALEASAYPLAQAFLMIEGNQKTEEKKEAASKKKIERVMDELLADPTDNDIEVLEKAIDKLKEAQKNEATKTVYLQINQRIEPSNLKKGILFTRSIEYIQQKHQNKSLTIVLKELDKFNLKRKEEEQIVFELAKRFDSILEYDKAIKYYKRAIELNIKMFGNKHNSLGFINNFLGLVYKDKGEFDKAINYYEKGLEIIGTQHPFSKSIYINLGTAWRHKAVYDKSIEFSDKALELALKNNGKYHNTTSMIYNNIGVVSSDMANYTKAEEAYKKALEIRIKLYGEMNSYTSNTYSNLGAMKIKNKKYSQAIFYLEKALAIDLKIHGENHSSTAITYSNLGVAFDNNSEYEKAINCQEKSLNILMKIHGESHPSVGTSYNNLGSAYSSNEDYNMAIKYSQKSLEISLKVHGEEHPSTATSYNNIGLGWKNKGNYDKAIKYYEKTLEIFVTIYGNEHQSVITVLQNIGKAWAKKENYNKSIEYFEKVEFLENSHLKKHDVDKSLTFKKLGELWNKKGEFLKSKRYYDKSLNIEIENKVDAERIASINYILGNICEKLNLNNEAIKCHENVLEFEKKTYGINDADTGITYFTIAELLLEIKNYKKALNYFRKGFVSNPDSGGFPFKIGICYENLKQHKEATKNYCLSAEIRKKALGLEDDSTQKAIQEAIRLAKKTENIKLLPDWIKEISNDQ